MADDARDTDNRLNVLESLPLDESTEAKVGDLWRQLMVYKSFADGDLAEAKARRAQAEAAREQLAVEIVSTTRALCGRMRADAERELLEARDSNDDAGADAQAELERVKEAIAQAERKRDQIVAEAENRAKEIQDEALKEIRTMLTRLENMRAAASEELETQRVLTDVSKLKASSSWFLGEVANGSPQGPSAADDPAAVASGQAQGPAALDDSDAVVLGPGDPAASDSNNGAPKRREAADKKPPAKP